MDADLIPAPIEAIAFPAVLTERRAQFVAVLDQLEQSQWWPAESLRRWQGRQAARLLAHAVRTVPFYARALRGLRLGPDLSPEDWQALPVLTKDQVRRQAEALRSRAAPASHGGLGEFWTTGSTGTPLRVVKSHWAVAMTGLLSAREALWQRRDLSAVAATIRIPGAHMDPAATLPEGGETGPAWGGPLGTLFRTGPTVALDIRTGVRHQLEWLARHRPAYLQTYPSNLRLLLRHLRATGQRLDFLRQVRTIAELVPAGLREECRAGLGVELVDSYGATEAGLIALQCPAGPHYHVQSEAVLVEVLDPAGRPCRPGETGRVVVTPLHAFAMPLIRYELGDYAELGGPCACGRGLPVLTRLFGRARNLLTLPSGEKRYSVFASSLFAESTAVRQAQIVQTARTRIEVRLAVDRALRPDEEDAMRAALARQLPPGFELAFAYVERIATDGLKFEEFVSEVGEG